MGSREFALFLYERGVIKFGDYKLSSGRKSPYYVDLRMIPSFPHQFRRTIKHLQSAISETVGFDGFDCIASVPTGGLVIAASLATEILKPLVYVRTRAKDYGTSKMIEGHIHDGMRVLMIDDVSTSGGSIANAVRLLRNESATVTDAFVILDRMEGACENLARDGVKLHCLVSVEEIARSLHRDKIISDKTMQDIESRMH